MIQKRLIQISLAVMLVLTSCATYNQHRSDGLVTTSVSTNPIEHRVFFIGDAGEETDEQRRVLKSLREQVTNSQVPTTVVYLGDNIYPVGMPSKKDSIERIVAANALRRQVEAVADLGAEVIFIPGNHDWKKGKPKGRKAVKRQQEWIEDLDLKNVTFTPEDGCPGPEVYELTDDVALILIDSEWWLQNWDRDKDINDKCDVQSRFDFLNELVEAVKDYKERQVIFAMHHPIISSGSHGGHFTVKDNLFPFTALNENLYIPLPVIGSLHPIFRSTYGHVQDEIHPKYTELIRAVMFAAQNHPEMVFISGHEHALEYHKKDGHHFLVSGSGSRTSAVGKPPSMEYGHGVAGYMQLDLRSGGGIDLKVWEPDEDGEAEMPEYASNLIISRTFEDSPVQYEDTPLPDSAVAIISAEYVRSDFYQLWFGERYRFLYDLPVNVRVLDLDEEKGGLVPLKKGGGMQTNSLRLEAPDGHQYVLRGLNKDATRLLPEIFQGTFANDLLQDQFTASHPYAAFVIPDMAEAAGIYHTNPEVVYVPEQPALGRYNQEFANGLYLYEERASGDWSGTGKFGDSDDLVNFNEVIEETMDDYHNRVDQDFVVRSRLFDMFVADWDRHDDQWRWAEFKDDEGKYYRPVPRDRDQAFANYAGILNKMARSTPNLRKMNPLTPDVKNAKWFNLNGQWFDRDFTNQLTRDDWVSTAKELQTLLTDDIIESSIQSWPEEVYEIQGPWIVDILKQRRDNLEDFANDYYDELARRIFIRGTNNADYFEVERFKDSTIVRVFDSNREGDKNDLYYERTFLDGETKQIEIYGLEGRDRFEVIGDGGSSIKVHMLGGEGKDRFAGQPGSAGKVRAYDTHDPEKGIGVRYREVDEEFNTYDRKSFHYDYGIPGLRAGYNPDDGVSFGGTMKWETHKFKKEPFASRHRVFAFYAFGSSAYGGGYFGEWKRVIGKAGIDLAAVYEAPTYVENYFGFGNDSEEFEDDIEYYRVRKRSFRLVPALTFGNGDDGHNFKLRVGMQSHFVDSTEGRFVTDPNNGLPDDVFVDRRFLLARAEYFVRSVDNPILTNRGIDFRATAGVDWEIEQEELHRFFKTSLTIYYQFKFIGQPVLATRIGAEWHGGEYQFYQGARLGAHENFRGMHKHRLVGDRLFYQNIDLRVNVANWRNYYLPAKMGFMLSFDHGRVWEPEEISNTWHYAYGGGLWISPFQTLLLSLGYHVSDLDERFEFHMGFFF